MVVAVDATLQVEQPDTTLAPLGVGTDAASPTGVALPVLDAGSRARLDSVLTGLSAILAQLASTLTVAGSVAVSNFPADTTLPSTPDVFGNVVTGQRDNQVEVHFDDAAWASFVTTTQTGGGGATQHEGHVHFESGTGANGRSKAVTLDVIKYRPMHEVYAGWTAAFPVAGVANSFMRIGFGDPDVNAAFIGYEGTALGITWRRGGVDTFIPRASWDDPLTGGAASRFTRGGVPETWNPAFTNVFRMRVGLLGSAPLIFEVLSPDQTWVPFHTIKRPNVDSEPTFTNFDLNQFVEVRKTGAGATALEIRTACWAGGTTSTKARLSDTITDRSLADTVRAVIEGKTPSGAYAKVTVNSAGRLQVTNDSVGTDGAALPAGTTLVGGTDGTNLQAMKVAADGTVQTRSLALATDTVRSIDIAETTGSLYAVINFATVGAHTIVAVPPGSRFRLRRFFLTACSVPDPLGDPVLEFTLGGTTIRSQVLVGRFPEDILGADGEDLVITSSKAGQIDGTVAYTLEPA